MICGSCKLGHESVADVQSCYADTAEAEAESRGELYAEAVMSWVAGGGSPEDAGRYASVVSRGGVWDGGLSSLEGIDTEAKCEHGLSAWLCEGPQHYPMDM